MHLVFLIRKRCFGLEICYAYIVLSSFLFYFYFLFLKVRSIGCEPHFMKRRSQIRILLPLPLCGHVKKKKVVFFFFFFFSQFTHSFGQKGKINVRLIYFQNIKALKKN
jgi:hypothetical protein